MDEEFLKALELVAEYDKQRPQILKELRVYYNPDGTVIGLWETEHPAGDNYIVIENRDIYDRSNTLLLRVVDGELQVIVPELPKPQFMRSRYIGKPTVSKHSAIALTEGEIYKDTAQYGIPRDKKYN
jgi:hypothetical protein